MLTGTPGASGAGQELSPLNSVVRTGPQARLSRANSIPIIISPHPIQHELFRHTAYINSDQKPRPQPIEMRSSRFTLLADCQAGGQKKISPVVPGTMHIE